MLAAPAKAPGPIFDCSIGTKRLTITQQGNALVYRYGTKRKAELRLVADAADQRVFYHRTLYPRGEDQTLRFVNGDHSYIVYAHWTAPSVGMTEGGGDPEVYYGGLIVRLGDKTLSSRSCTDDNGDMREWPIFKTLPQDKENRVPAE
ncbi:hypothetical protein [Sphingopyxis sp.]|uniref:hypothetical protein n=1 Tax=Sphingopyxis sp. TaxID=1908224 RepID=UPI003D14CE60